MNTPRIEVYLGNWGTVICFNEQHKEYLIAAKAYSDCVSSFNSWHGAWLSDAQKAEYTANMQAAKAKADALWDAIPNKTDDLSKSH